MHAAVDSRRPVRAITASIHTWLPWAVALVGATLSLALLYPGQYPYDAAFQLWQARSGHYANVSPLAMPMLWSALLAFGGHPASLLALNLAMFWVGLGLCICAIRAPLWIRCVGLAAGGLLPLTLVQMAHLLTDAHLAAVLMLATGLLVRSIVLDSRAACVASLLLFLYAGCVRHNAVFAVLPFAAVFIRARPLRQRVAAAALLCATTLTAAFALDRLAVERLTTWPTIALWDLAAISVATDRLLLPDFAHGPALSVSELVETGAFDPASNTHLFTRSRSGIAAGLSPAFSSEQLAGLRARWVRAIVDHPGAYAEHRWRTWRLLVGVPGDRGVAYFVARQRYGDDPALPEPWLPRAQAWLYAHAAVLHSSGWMSALPALGLNLLAMLLAWRRRVDAIAQLAGVAAGSAMLYASSFLVLAPGAELRYLTWPIVIAPMALLMALAGRSRQCRRSAAFAEGQTQAAGTAK